MEKQKVIFFFILIYEICPFRYKHYTMLHVGILTQLSDNNFFFKRIKALFYQYELKSGPIKSIFNKIYY